MTYTPQQWKNVLAHKGKIDPATERLARQAVALSDKIEFHLRNISHLNEDSQTYKTGSQIIKQYALEYKQLTGDWYVRSFP